MQEKNNKLTPLGVNYRCSEINSINIESVKIEVTHGTTKTIIYRTYKEPDLMSLIDQPEKLFNKINELWQKKNQ